MAAACELVTFRMVKYDANSAAKNISSEASQMMVPTATMLRAILAATQARQRDGMQRALWHRHRSGDCVRVHSHVVIIAGTRAEVTPRHNFVYLESSAALLGETGELQTERRQRSGLHLTGCVNGPGPHAMIHPGRAWRPQTAPAATPQTLGISRQPGDDQWPASRNLETKRF